MCREQIIRLLRQTSLGELLICASLIYNRGIALLKPAAMSLLYNSELFVLLLAGFA